MKTTFRAVLKALALSFIFAVPAIADTVTLYPSQDMWCGSYYNKTSQNGSYIKIGGHGDTYLGCWQFNTSSIPVGASVTSAILYMPPYTTMNAGFTKVSSVTFVLLTTPWNEYNTPFSSLRGWNCGSFYLNPNYGINFVMSGILDYWKTNSNCGIALVPGQVSNNYYYFPSRENGTTNKPRLVVTYTVPVFKLGFPAKNASGSLLSPYSTIVTSIQDHNMTLGQMTTLLGQKSSSTVWFKNLTFGVITGGFNQGPFIYEYDTNRSWVAYDNHDGYDYKTTGTFVAPADGVVYVGTLNTVKNGSIWRNPAYTTPTGKYLWEGYHAIYIDHGNGYVSYSYHCSDLDPGVKQTILNQGYALVKKGASVGIIGGFMNYSYTGAPVHLHFGIYKGSVLVDPYGGFEGNSVLWDQ